MSTAVTPQVKHFGGRPVLVVGAGRMGLAIAQIFAENGLQTRVVEANEAARLTTRVRLRDICAARGMDEECIDRVQCFDVIEQAGKDIAFAVEAVPEDLALKRQLFARLEQACPSDAILATNTSVLPVGQIGQNSGDRKRIVGTHFWNPPYAVRLVEVVQATETSDETVSKTMQFLESIGQLPVHVRKDIPGFIGNRLQHALKREAIALVQNGVCDAETVDFVVRNSFGARLGVMGPLEQSDMVGLKLTLAIHQAVLADLDTSPAPQRLLVELVESGRTGAAVGQGFRRWTPEQRVELYGRLDNAFLPQKRTGDASDDTSPAGS